VKGQASRQVWEISMLAAEFEHAEDGFFGSGAEVFGEVDLGGEV
jgi:hypothetical protein